MRWRRLQRDIMFIIAMAVVATVIAGCACTVERGAAKNVEDTQSLILPEYLKYVESDAALTAAQRDDRKKAVESLKKLTSQLRKNLGD